MMLKPVLPCAAMGLFVPDEATDTVVGRYAAGAHAGMIRELCASPGEGIVGWVAAHRQIAVNAQPALDFGRRLLQMDPPLLSCIALPLVHDKSLLAVVSVYSTSSQAFTDDHACLLELLAPKIAASIAAVHGWADAEPDRARPMRRSAAAGDLRLLKGIRSG